LRDLCNSVVSLLLVATLVSFPLGCSHASDEAIAEDVQGKISADPDTKDSNVSVEAKDGKITLSGSTKSQAAKQKIEQIAREESGAKSVEDHTTILPSATKAFEQPSPQPIVIPAGTVFVVTTSQALSSKNSHAGQTFLATLAQPVRVEGRTAFPKGATASGTVVTAKTKGKVKGQGELALTLTNISTEGQTYQIQTNLLSSTVKGKGKRTAATTGGGAAGGALIGGLAGGGKGAGIGALVGATAGFVGGAFTGNKQIEVPAESPLSFTLTAPLTLPPVDR
jgi:osmotically-inducible protein OsmY